MLPNERTIALIGYRGTGKTSVAQALALRLGWNWADADVEIELKAGKNIAAIFADEGEQVFRDMESQVLETLCHRARTVLALGGGAVLRPENRQFLQSCQAVAWLQASAQTIARRLESDPATALRRPNLTNHGGRTEIDLLLTERAPIYRECATLEVDTEDRAPAEIADAILTALTNG